MSFDPNATWIFTCDKRRVIARAIATRSLPGRMLVILRDTSEVLWIGEWTETGGTVPRGPVTLAEALRAAEDVIYGLPHHGSVAALTTSLALGLLIFNAAVEQPEVLNPTAYPIDPNAAEVRAC